MSPRPISILAQGRLLSMRRLCSKSIAQQHGSIRAIETAKGLQPPLDHPTQIAGDLGPCTSKENAGASLTAQLATELPRSHRGAFFDLMSFAIRRQRNQEIPALVNSRLQCAHRPSRYLQMPARQIDPLR